MVGQYIVDVVVKQVIANGDYFINKDGNQQTMPETRYLMTVTINPCKVDYLDPVITPTTMIYTLGEGFSGGVV